MRYFLLILTFSLFSQKGFSQSTEDSVKAVVNDLFTAMRNGDAGGLASVFSESAVMQTITRNREKMTVVRNETVSEFAEFVGKLKKDSADERIIFESIKIDGPMAAVWTPYEFYFNGKFSHCGVNSFQLVRFDGEWKIQYLIDTRRITGCRPIN